MLKMTILPFCKWVCGGLEFEEEIIQVRSLGYQGFDLIEILTMKESKCFAKVF